MAGLINDTAGLEAAKPPAPGLVEQNMPDLLEQARTVYPYMQDKEVNFMQSKRPGEGKKLEYWPNDEPGDEAYPRPPELPIGKAGIEVFEKDVRPIDVLADYVSHEGVYRDPKLAALYQEFAKRTDPAVLQARYQYHRENYGENRPYEQWLERAGLPEIFRGYTFDQWGKDAKDYYTPEQLEVLDEVRRYLGIDQKKGAQ